MCERRHALPPGERLRACFRRTDTCRTDAQTDVTAKRGRGYLDSHVYGRLSYNILSAIGPTTSYWLHLRRRQQQRI